MGFLKDELDDLSYAMKYDDKALAGARNYQQESGSLVM